MRRTRIALVSFGIAAAVLVWLLIETGDAPRVEFESGFVAADEVEPEIVEEVLDPDGEVALEVEEVLATRSFSPPVESDAPPRSETTAIAVHGPDSAFVRGLLRDEATGEPLPLYALRIQGESGRWEDVSTGEDGRFTTGSPMEGGTIRIVPFDDPNHRRELPEIAVERRVDDGMAPDLDLSVPCGPTYRLSISPREVVPTTLVARLRVGSLDGVPALGPESVRAGDVPWVRFAPVPEDVQRCERIDVFDKAGLWFGSASVSALAGVVPGIVDILLDGRAVLLGKLVDVHGDPLRRASVLFQGASPSGGSRSVRTFTRWNGEFRIDQLSSGNGIVTVRTLRHGTREASIRLLAGAVTRQDFVVEPLPSPGGVRGLLESETGNHQAKASVVLRSLGLPGLSETHQVDWEDRNGRRVGVFAFEDLPAGEYEVAVQGGGWCSWEPAKLTASPPSEAARFLLRDGVSQAEFEFRPRDVETGADLDTVHASWNVPGGSSGSRWLRPGKPVFTKFPLDRSLRWRLDRSGYQPKLGDEKSFGIEEVREGVVWRVAEVELTPGWGEVFRIVREGNRKPIADAKILLDGREAGTTKGDGTCTVSARERPRRVEVAYRDWKVVAPVDLRPAWKRKEKRFVTVEVVPPKR